MTPDEVPQELIDIVDRLAGREHSRAGPVVACLAEVLTRWEELRAPVQSCVFCERPGLNSPDRCNCVDPCGAGWCWWGRK